MQGQLTLIQITHDDIIRSVISKTIQVRSKKIYFEYFFSVITRFNIQRISQQTLIREKAASVEIRNPTGSHLKQGFVYICLQ